MEARHHTRPLVVGIAGGTASGKSTLSERLAIRLSQDPAQPSLGVHTFHMDRYFLKVRPHMRAPISGRRYEDHNHPDSFDLTGLLRDLDARLAGGIDDVVIVEGLLTLQHTPLRERLDLKLFIDTPADERIVRRLKRNMAHGLAFDDIATFYLESVRYRHEEFVEPSRWHADLVLNGGCPSDLALEVVADWILRRRMSSHVDPMESLAPPLTLVSDAEPLEGDTR